MLKKIFQKKKMKKINKKIFNYNNTKCIVCGTTHIKNSWNKYRYLGENSIYAKDLLLKEKNCFVCNQKFMILQQNIKETEIPKDDVNTNK
jgi:hypothetical protein